MDDLNALVQEAIAAVKAGRKQEGRDKLLAVIERNDRHEQAWLGLSALVETMEERVICLENVLAINPANERAKNALAKLGGQPPAPPAPPVQPATPAPAAEAPYDPFGNTSFEPFDPYQSEPFDSGSVPSSLADDAPFGDLGAAGIADVVDDDVPDWYKSVPSQPSAQDADGPTSEHYDQWVEQLNLNPRADASLEGTFGDSPFGGDSPFESAPAPWDDPSLDEDLSPHDAPWPAVSNPFDDVSENEVFDPFGSTPSRDRQPAPSVASPTLSGSVFTFDSGPGGPEDDEDEEFSFDFDDDAVPAAAGATGGWLAQASTPAPSAPFTGMDLATAQVSTSTAAVPSQVGAVASVGSANMQAYFQQIPADIEAVPPSRWSRQRMMLVLGILVLLVLNAASIGLLVMTL